MKNRIGNLLAFVLLILPTVHLTAQSAKERFINEITGSPSIMVFSLVAHPPYMINKYIGRPRQAVIVGRCEYDALDFSHSSEIPITGKIIVLQQLAGPVAPEDSPLVFNLMRYNTTGGGDLRFQIMLTAREKQYNFYGIVDSSNMNNEPGVFALLDDVWLKALLQDPVDRKKLDPILASIHSDDDALKVIRSVQTDIYLAFAIFKECLIAQKVETPDTAETIINIYRNNHEIGRVFSGVALHDGSPEIQKTELSNLISKLNSNPTDEDLEDVRMSRDCNDYLFNQNLLDQLQAKLLSLMRERGYLDPNE